MMTFGEKALSDYSNLIWNSKSGLISCFSKKLQSQEEFLARKVGFSQEKTFFYSASFSGFFLQFAFESSGSLCAAKKAQKDVTGEIVRSEVIGMMLCN